MFSMPPATIRSASPTRIAWLPSMAAFMPEPQTLLMVAAPTVAGMPALRAACRAGAWPAPACSTMPISTSSIWAASTPARRRAPRMATAPSSVAGSFAISPSKLPMGVRAPDRITTSRPLWLLTSSPRFLHACKIRSINCRPMAASKQGMRAIRTALRRWASGRASALRRPSVGLARAWRGGGDTQRPRSAVQWVPVDHLGRFGIRRSHPVTHTRRRPACA